MPSLLDDSDDGGAHLCEGNGIVEEDNEVERTATRAIAAAVVSIELRDDEHLHIAAQIAAGIANRDLYAIAGRIPEVSFCCCNQRNFYPPEQPESD